MRGQGQGGRRAASSPNQSTATLELHSRPEGASIFVDGRPTGLKTPATISGLPVGRTLKLRIAAEGLSPGVAGDDAHLRPAARRSLSPSSLPQGGATNDEAQSAPDWRSCPRRSRCLRRAPRSAGAVVATVAAILSFGALGAAAWLANAELDRVLSAQDDEALAQASRTLEELVNRQREQLVSEVKVLADDNRIRATVLAPKFDQATVQDVLEDLRKSSGATLLAVLDASGKVQAVTGAVSLREVDLSGSTAVRAAFEQPTSDIWTLPDQVQVIGLAPIRSGSETPALLVKGLPLAKSQLATVETALGVAGAVFIGDRVAASSSADARHEEAVRGRRAPRGRVGRPRPRRARLPREDWSGRRRRHRRATGLGRSPPSGGRSGADADAAGLVFGPAGRIAVAVWAGQFTTNERRKFVSNSTWSRTRLVGLIAVSFALPRHRAGSGGVRRGGSAARGASDAGAAPVAACRHRRDGRAGSAAGGRADAGPEESPQHSGGRVLRARQERAGAGALAFRVRQRGGVEPGAAARGAAARLRITSR